VFLSLAHRKLGLLETNTCCLAALGPLLSGFAVPVKGWRWALYEPIWAAAPIFILMMFFLPETSNANILLRRAERLRKITGNQRFMSQSEIDQRNMKVSAVFIDALIKPLEITIKDPAVLFVQIYTAIIYGIYYSCKSLYTYIYIYIYISYPPIFKSTYLLTISRSPCSL
jgi:DHA1 family multidrug resistance protein-like MFS transporter